MEVVEKDILLQIHRDERCPSRHRPNVIHPLFTDQDYFVRKPDGKNRLQIRSSCPIEITYDGSLPIRR